MEKTAFQMAHDAAVKDMQIAAKAGERWAARQGRDTTLVKVQAKELTELLAAVYNEYYSTGTLSADTMQLIEHTLKTIKRD
jgi:hypothetical protein